MRLGQCIVMALLGCLSAFDATAQAYSAHSTSVAVSKSDGSPPVIYNSNRDVHLWSADGSKFQLQFPGCLFDVVDAAIDSEVEETFRPNFEKHFAGVGWVGEIAFIGSLRNPVRNDISKPLLHGFECDATKHEHLIAVSRWTGDTPLESLGVLERFAIIDYQMDPRTFATTNYFVALRVDILTADNAEKASGFVGAFLKGILSH
jgi:hypothetical protein